MTRHIGHNLGIALCAILAILFAVLTVLSLLPPATTTGIEVKENIEVSSSASNDGRYLVQLRGRIINKNDVTRTVERLEIVIGNGKTESERTLVLKDIELDPRTEYDLSDNTEDWSMEEAYDRVLSVTVTDDDVTEQIENQTVGLHLNLTTLLWGVLLVIDGIVLWKLCVQRYYLAEEDRLSAT
ncbi:MAG: hypothetical protein IJW30_03095 [Clostridia bacterium]|nr:hypothetical protein [Clostridia bacterium]